MDFDLAEQNYIRLQRLHQNGQIADDEYRSQLNAMRVVDEQGYTWMVQEGSGRWYRWDGAQWAPATPPGRQPAIVVPQAAPAAPQAQPGLQGAPLQWASPPGAYPSAAQQPAAAYAPQMPPAVVYPQQPQMGAMPPAGPAQPGVSQAFSVGYVAQPVVPQQTMLARKRPGCVAITFRMLLWALVWGGAAWAVNSLLHVTPWWAYLGVGLGALITLVLWVRLITRHGRALRQLTKGGVA